MNALRRTLLPIMSAAVAAPLVLAMTVAPATASDDGCGKKYKIAEANSGVSKVTVYSQKCGDSWRLSGSLYDTKGDDRAAEADLLLYEKGASHYATKHFENGKGAHSSSTYSFDTRGSLDVIAVETRACNSFGCSDKSPYEDARPKG